MADTGGAPFSHPFPDHSRNLLEQLNIQRYYGAFCDVIVRIQDYDFKVHQCVLAASCPKLQAAIYGLRQEMSTAASQVLTLKEVTVGGFRVVLDFLYTGTLKLDVVQLGDVLTAAQYLEIRAVEKACHDYQYYKGVSAGGIGEVSVASAPVTTPQPVVATTTCVPSSQQQQLQQHPTPMHTPQHQQVLDLTSEEDGYRDGTVGVYSTAEVTPPPVMTPQAQVAVAPVSTSSIAAHVTTSSSSLAFDTNYIEDYLKLIESLQGVTDTHQVAPPPGCSSVMRYSSAGVRVDIPRAALTQVPPDPRYGTSASQLQLQSPALSSPPPLKPLGFPSAAGSQTGTYSAEDMRKTILSVLSQERFDDEEEEEGVVVRQTQHEEQMEKYDHPPVPPPAHPPDRSPARLEVDLAPPTLTPEPSCVLPSIINIVPHHRRQPPDITQVMPPLSVSQPHVTVTGSDSSVGAVPAPTLIPLCDNHALVSTSESDEQDNDIVCHDNRTCATPDSDTTLDEEPGECSDSRLPLQNVCLTNLDTVTPEDINGPLTIPTESPESTQQQNSLPVGGESDCISPHDEDIVQIKSLKKQKRKKKIPMKVNRQAALDSDEDPTQVHHIKQEKGFEGMSASNKRRGRPRKEQTKPLKKRDVAVGETTPTPNSGERRKLVCDQCGRAFGKQELLSKHKEMHQRALLYECHICGMKYARPAELTRHQRTHSDVTFHCTKCNHVFGDPRDYKRHMEAHGVEKPFLCSFPGCEFRSAKPSIVDKHMVIHSGVKMHPCNRCGKLFAQPSGLRSHLRSCLQQRAYLCDFCGASFNHLQSLKSHRMLHTGEKPYFCHDCGARFTDHRNFKRHRRIHDGAFPYACMHCDKNFRHSNSLKAHLKTHGIASPPPGFDDVKVNHFHLPLKQESDSGSSDLSLLGSETGIAIGHDAPRILNHDTGHIPNHHDGAPLPGHMVVTAHDPAHIAGQVIQVKGESATEGHIALHGQGHVSAGQVQGHTGALTANVC